MKYYLYGNAPVMKGVPRTSERLLPGNQGYQLRLRGLFRVSNCATISFASEATTAATTTAAAAATFGSNHLTASRGQKNRKLRLEGGLTGTQFRSSIENKDEYHFRMYEKCVHHRSTFDFNPTICSTHLQFTGTRLIGCN